VEAFVDQVRAFCDFIRGAGDLPPAERLATAHERLTALYAAAIRGLPASPPLDDAAPDIDTSPTSPTNWCGFDSRDFYWTILDPFEEPSAPVGGLLSDDLLDIYGDLQPGLDRWLAGDTAIATWHWRNTFDTHWGTHATTALHALHHARLR
jgi:hypothetical protein